MMGVRERRVRRYVESVCAMATARDKGAVYDAGEHMVLRRGDMSLAEDLVQERGHCMLVISDQKNEQPRVIVVGINAVCAWNCLTTGMRGLIVGGLVPPTSGLFETLEEMRRDVSRDNDGVVLTPARDAIMTDLTDADVALAIRCFEGREIPEDVQKILQSRKIVEETR